MSDSLRPNGLQQTRLPGISLSLGVCSNSVSIEWVMPFNHFILCPCLLLLSVLPSIRVFSSELTLCIRWPKYWSFSIHPSNEYSGLISFRIDWFDFLAVQGSLQDSSPPLPHFESINSLAFFMAQFSHPHMTTV